MPAPTIGIIGASGIAQFHYQGFEEAGARVAIIADVNAERAQPYVQRTKAAFTTKWQDVIAHPQVQAVCVFTPTGLHYEMVKAALAAGKHVICEKTLTLSAAQSLELGRLATAKQLCLYTSYMKRYFPAARQARELVAKLGHVTSVYARTYQGVGGADLFTTPVSGGWARGADGMSSCRRMYGGGVLVCGGSHIWDLLLFLIGKPSRVYGRSFPAKDGDFDAMFHGLLDLPGGAVGHFEANWHPLKQIGYEKRGWDEGFEIGGLGGRIIFQTPVWNDFTHNAPLLRFYDNSTGSWTEYSFPILNPFALAEKEFLGQIAKGQQGEQDAFTGYRVDLLLETAQRSADTNQPLDLHWEA